jgi:hypothetical protein
MGRTISSPNTFKTCYIAEVKEELGILKRRLRKRGRKVRTPEKYKPYIRKAIERLGEEATYKEIQEEAFRLYMEENGFPVDKYFGALKLDRKFVDAIALDKDIYYLPTSSN